MRAAKAQLAAAMRTWAIWAGLRTADGSAPPLPRWVEEGAEWRLLSGGFLAGRVRQPTIACHWQLLTSGPMQGPGALFGQSASIDAAKADLLKAWQTWLVWAELLAP